MSHDFLKITFKIGYMKVKSSELRDAITHQEVSP